MTIDESTDSLLAALTKTRIPAGNHEFIRKLTQAVGIADFRAVVREDKSHVVARRRDGRPDLHIYYGYTNGFTSTDEIRSVAGPGVVGRPSSRKGTWYVEHPINHVRPAGERSRDVRRQSGFCRCGMQLSLTGVCDSCD
ncbi:hypothetical protein ACTWP6_08780 [Mycobacterium sp. 4D054]|uniref:hypothetical protein n=1 Tax=unclassified Mycobacterium TaxID=2642494 RepID=UPI0021B32181|nr:hypothetical protein [Mycobacterium sp. SMC-8]UXA14508.1 hypothetical protein KXD97_12445 [Mycobacterium sp. SMC-8]